MISQAFRVKIEKWWAYFSELVLALLLCCLLWMYAGIDPVFARILERKPELMTLMGIFLGLTGVIFAAYIAVLQSDLGKRLRLHGAAVEYTYAFAVPFLTLVLTTTTVSFCEKRRPFWLACLVTFLLTYCAVNIITMVMNVIGLVKLWQCVDKARETGKS